MPIVFARVLAAVLRLVAALDPTAPEPTIVPLELRGDLALVRVEVNGRPGLLILDTGSGVVTLDSAFAREASIDTAGPRALVRGARNVTMRLGTARSIHVGSAEVRNASVAVISAIADVQARVGFDVHGTIGWDLFSKYVAVIDYDARTLTLYEPDAFTYRGSGVVLPVSTPHRLPIVQARIVTRTRGAIDARLMLDLGSASYAVRLATPFVTAHGIDKDTVTVTAPFGAGVGGVSEGKLLRLPRLEVGGLRIERPSTALSESTEGGFGNDAQHDGTIGSPVFRRTRMIVDLPHDRVILEPRRRLDVPDSVDASGLTIVADPGAPPTLRVAYVIAGSAASKAGVRVGDEVVQIDGRPASSLAPYQLREFMRTPGQRLRLALRRGTQPLDVMLVLAPII